MKRLFAVLMALVLLGACCVAEIDVKGMSTEELEALNEAVQLELIARKAASPEGMRLAAGTYIVGKNFPIGVYRVETPLTAIVITGEGMITDDFFIYSLTNDHTSRSLPWQIGRLELVRGIKLDLTGDAIFYTYTGIY